ncbi:unnamed protein product [Euphydryas editha]|uniref:Uncharacterized protein n=1 Tax=Euphydryas editha TaxID=104508 RepID=A0AAU9TGZ5_EUPED|nr:unnamed protein product [Euphydryas editha]
MPGDRTRGKDFINTKLGQSDLKQSEALSRPLAWGCDLQAQEHRNGQQQKLLGLTQLRSPRRADMARVLRPPSRT